MAEDLRGHGIGRLILVAAVDLARSLGSRRLAFGSNSKLPAAVHV